MGILKYKDFEGSADLDTDRWVCRGKLLFIDDLVTYEATTPAALQAEFEAAVDDYVETCREIGKEPQKACRGQFNVRVSSELHKTAQRRANAENISLNAVVGKALEAYLAPAHTAITAPSMAQSLLMEIMNASATSTIRKKDATAPALHGDFIEAASNASNASIVIPAREEAPLVH